MNERKNKKDEKMRDVVDGSCQNQRAAKCLSFTPLGLLILTLIGLES